LSNDSAEVNVLDRPKTPQAPEQPPPPPRDTNLPPSLPFPFFPPFPAAPGLIPHPMFPLPLHKALPGMVGPPNPAVMPGMLRQRFFRPKMEPGKSMVPPSLIGESLRSPTPSVTSSALSLKQQQQQQQQQQLPMDKPRPIKSPDNEVILSSPKIPASMNYLVPDSLTTTPILNSSGGALMAPIIPPAISPVVPAPLLPPNLPITKSLLKPEKGEKVEKADKVVAIVNILSN
jgi:hypothetical protein